MSQGKMALNKSLNPRNSLGLTDRDPCNWELSSLDSLQAAELDKNPFSAGEIPDFFQNATTLTNFCANSANIAPSLTQFDVSNNQLSEQLPSVRSNIVENSSAHGTSSFVGILIVLSMILFSLCCFVCLNCVNRRKQKRVGRVQSSNSMVDQVHPRHSGSDSDSDSSADGVASNESYNRTNSGPSEIQMVHRAKMVIDPSANVVASNEQMVRRVKMVIDPSANVVASNDRGNMVIPIEVLRKATDNFSEKNILGRGGFGTVYKGELRDGTKTVVKRMNVAAMTEKARNEKGLKEFEFEVAVLTQVRHRHLVGLHGYCLDGDERLLVYEYMPLGTLSWHLFHWKEDGLMPLNWISRLTIALDVGRGVEYLHSLAPKSCIHRDFKPSNILLGDGMRTKVADYGLVRLVPEGKASIETKGLAGTFGYIDPVYTVMGRITTKVDVYSFGVILMALITGRRAVDHRQSEDNINLVTWLKKMHRKKDALGKAIDPTIDRNEETLASISIIAKLARHCCKRDPSKRPDMKHTVTVISSLAE